jgi:hypothetical protein
VVGVLVGDHDGDDIGYIGDREGEDSRIDDELLPIDLGNKAGMFELRQLHVLSLLFLPCGQYP